ncbi:amidohydrolase family protein [Treponema sp. TIM-1]|uniref:N-acyl-D-amino-acid deacylase family protein n=1 Tax=Treponema sp. TIM-1 TaxID=2898417 RepID=UPI00397FE08B
MGLLIKNAEIFDGLDENAKTGHVLVEGDRISAVLDREPAAYTGEVLDAAGLTLSSGFIDTHSHNDFYGVLPNAQKYIRPFVEQGITTQVAGNCGFSTVGIAPDTPYGRDLFAFFAPNPDYQQVATFAGWAEAVDRCSPVNMACLCGHGTIRTSLRGLGPGALTPAEAGAMERLVEGELEAGAAGLSYGLMYDPGMYGGPEELLGLAKIAARHNKPITFHARALSRFSTSYPELFGRAHNLRALDEVLEIAEKSGAKTHLSHVIFVGRNTWNTLDETISLIDGANQRGLDLSFDLYPFDFGASTITVALPAWYRGLPPEEKRKLPVRLRLRAEIFATRKLLGFGFDDVQISYAGAAHSEYTGKRISEIAREKGIGAFDAYIAVIDETGPETTVIMYSYLNDRIIDLLSRHPKTAYMTDAWITDAGMQNPAAFGAFPKFLRLSREGKAETLGRMIRKMTSQAAERFGLKNRGRVAPGYYADLVLFNRNTVAESSGERPPIGLPHVIINGEFAVRDGVYQGKSPGRALPVA